jgi:hypothetical protein
MGRQVVTEKDLDEALKKAAAPTRSAMGGGIAGADEDSPSDANNPPKPTRKEDQFADRLLKYIPAEVDF